MKPPFERFRQRVGWLLLRRNRYQARMLARPVSLHSARAIALMWGADFEASAVQHLISELTSAGKEVYSLTYTSDETSAGELRPTIHLDARALDVWKRPRRSHVAAFLNRRFDVLINIDPQNTFALQYMAAVARAALKIGVGRPHDPAIYDVIIDMPPGAPADQTVQQLLHYLQNITKT